MKTPIRTVLILLSLVFLAEAIPANAADPPQVGDQQVFWVWDLSVMPPLDKQITAQCIGVSDHAYIFIEDGQEAEFPQEKVDSVLNAFDVATPEGSINPDEGIYEIETGTYGPLTTDVDGLPGISLLYFAMGEYMGYTFDGYFRADDLTNGGTSNHREMLHMNITDRDPAGDYMVGIIAHEFSHLINEPKDANEDNWLAETLAESAMILTGYPTDTDWVQSYADDPGNAGLYGDAQTVNYGAVFLMGAYLYESFGAEGLKTLADDPANGVTSVDQLVYDQWGTTFEEFFSSWALSNLIDDPNGDYGYTLIDVPPLQPETEINLADGAAQVHATKGAMSFASVQVAEGDQATWTSDGPQPDGAAVYGVFQYEDGTFGEPLDLLAEQTAPYTQSLQFASAGTLRVVLINPSETSNASLDFNIQPGTADDDSIADDDTTGDDDTAGGDDTAGDDDATGDDAADDDTAVSDDESSTTGGSGDDDSGSNACGC